MLIDFSIELLAIIISISGLILTIVIAYFQSRKEIMERLHKAEIELEKKHREIESRSTDLIYKLNKENSEELHIIKINITELKKDHDMILPLVNVAKKAGEKSSDEVYKEDKQ
ncbi:hypothetical protein [Methanolacinia paynteri]|uniref:hypothetical protein n=1 Tax=Methanolacinia paynteri TaxID=230356 RepID=UPI0006500301|nr:hypothetical protein [Methanolacinia paynteri]